MKSGGGGGGGQPNFCRFDQQNKKNRQLLAKKFAKYFYSYAKKFSKQKCSIPMLFNEAKRTCTNPEVIANILQRQFSSVFSDPSATNINDALFQSPSLQKPFIDDMLAFSVADIMEAIDEIKPGAAAGPDDLPVLLLKKCNEALSKPIHMIWQHSMSTGTLHSTEVLQDIKHCSTSQERQSCYCGKLQTCVVNFSCH